MFIKHLLRAQIMLDTLPAFCSHILSICPEMKNKTKQQKKNIVATITNRGKMVVGT